MKKRTPFLLLLLACLALHPFGTSPANAGALRKHPLQQLPVFNDDAPFGSLEKAIRQSINYYNKISPGQTFTYCGKTLSAPYLVESLESFLSIAKEAPDTLTFQQKISQNFLVCRPEKPDEILVTGYYEPLLEGSLNKKPPFIYPLYTLPTELADHRDMQIKAGIKKPAKKIFWTRGQIENNSLLAGQELVFLSSPLDAFILHIQGSGKIHLQDGTTRSIHYAGSNGRPYRSIGRLLVDEGKIALEDVSMPLITKYLNDNPDDMKRILHYNESFIFFQWEKGDGPIGYLEEPLTAGRSLAADFEHYPAGGLGVLESKKPVINSAGDISGWAPMTRYVLLQDSGSAIKGPRRLDFFWGNGDYAKTAAGAMRQPGSLFLLVKKQERNNP